MANGLPRARYRTRCCDTCSNTRFCQEPRPRVAAVRTSTCRGCWSACQAAHSGPSPSATSMYRPPWPSSPPVRWLIPSPPTPLDHTACWSAVVAHTMRTFWLDWRRICPTWWWRRPLTMPRAHPRRGSGFRLARATTASGGAGQSAGGHRGARTAGPWCALQRLIKAQPVRPSKPRHSRYRRGPARPPLADPNAARRRPSRYRP